MTWRERLKLLLHVVAMVAVAPEMVSFVVRSVVLGRDRALQGSTQQLSKCAGLTGQYLRRAFLCYALKSCHRSVTVEFGAIFSKAGAFIEENVYIGPCCHIGLVHIERDALLAAGVHVPSGPHTHGSDELEMPMRDQPGDDKVVTIGAGAWIGSGAIVMADIGRGSIVGAGAVVTRPVPERVVVGGVPARVIRERGPQSPEVAT